MKSQSKVSFFNIESTWSGCLVNAWSIFGQHLVNIWSRFGLTQNIRTYKIETPSLYINSNSFWRQSKSDPDKSDFQNFGTVLTGHQWSLSERFLKGSVNMSRKATKHFKRIEKKASLKLWHIQIHTLSQNGCVLFIGNVQTSLLV